MVMHILSYYQTSPVPLTECLELTPPLRPQVLVALVPTSKLPIDIEDFPVEVQNENGLSVPSRR